MHRAVTVLLLVAVATSSLASPINADAEKTKPEVVPVEPAVAKAKSLNDSTGLHRAAGARSLPVSGGDGHLVAEARSSGPLLPSPVDPLQKRDGAHHGSGGQHGGGSFGSTGTSSYASAPNSFIGGSGGGGHAVGFSSSGGGGGFGGSGGHHHGGGGGGFGGSGSSSYSSGAISNHIVGSSGHGGGHGHGGGIGQSGGLGLSGGHGGGGYGAPPVQSYGAAPQKQTGYYYYYYPVQVEDEGGDKKGEKGFMDKMKKMFEPMMYPWTAMMDYFGYGDDYDYEDYDYEGYGTYARSMVSRASEYVPWEAVNELSNVVTQDQCVEFFVCQLGSYGREYRNMHFLLDYIISDDDETNSYTRSFKDSVLKKTNCDLYNCPMFRRREGAPEA